MTDLEYEDMTLCEKENVEEPCNDTDCIYYEDCLKEWHELND